MRQMNNYFKFGIYTGVMLAVFVLAAPILAQAGAIVAIEEAAGSSAAAEAGRSSTGSKSGGSRESSYSKAVPPKTVSSKTKNKPSRSGQSAAQVLSGKPYSGPVLGDTYTFLNFEVISAEKPIYRRVAKQAGASGLVQVAILVETDGSVLQAKARTGNKLLWDEAERAALASKLNRPSVNGQPVRALGFLVYRFGTAEGDDDN
jgi:outer membrane biosynthesis protein TonB